MLIIGFASFVLFVHGVVALRYIEVNNRNDYPIWIQTQGNNGHPALLNGQIMKFDAGASFKYDIEEDGWSGRLWPKTECQPNGQNCEFGQSVPSCPTEGGCHWPAETRVEFFFPPNGDLKAAYYNISLMDGYSLGAEIIPYSNENPLELGSCIRTVCNVTFGECPANELAGSGDLTVIGRSKNVVGCLSPCSKWIYPPPMGLGRNKQDDNGRWLCCPTPITAEECRRGIILQTEYVDLIRRVCRTAFSYSYDDLAGPHYCPSTVNFVVSFYSEKYY